MSFVLETGYLVAAVLLILGLRGMSSPRTAHRGLTWVGIGMVVAVLVTFIRTGAGNIGLMLTALVIGGVLAAVYGRQVPMTAMPQGVALFNGMGGGAAGAIAAVELVGGATVGGAPLVLGVLGALIGTVSFAGSGVAFTKLQGWMRRPVRFPAMPMVNGAVALVAVALGIAVIAGAQMDPVLGAYFAAAVALGILVTLPIGGADMPVVISLYNAATGLAVAFEGYLLNNPAMVIAGTVVGAAGTLLTLLMARAMHRSVFQVVGAGFRAPEAAAETGAEGGLLKGIEPVDAAIQLGYARKVVIIPGYGMAVAQAQHKVWELVQRLEERGVEVRFAIHPVAGRMPGHMNVLLAEAGVPYDMVADLETINPELPQADVALVIGANDVVNPSARNVPDSPIYGMPIINADQARNVLVIKRGGGQGFSGVENPLFTADHARVLFRDALDGASELVQALKQV
ncbi:NAD(P) transhydrogenase subunit beta [Thiohalorhabdus denitrificans]|uniref:NAD(P) transhydrogenase subunit beta n=1 Tax=Thiohalorhabdus denitrificans TaxID=381306 RepID=A0A0P9ELZ2_9GAMM|nr:NAD(P)(+) transhydrogenase (Re/Si-specific) subunit beta [Thiohalorhabdus denitrificans]KPV39606.1 NAD(P) transhydrogenase subunit beta [Thiohalorhabdus denitrificans]SCX96961.1 NAD(P) transhydrogenase subunit beta [Thiohalorhabdus denitrificans]